MYTEQFTWIYLLIIHLDWSFSLLFQVFDNFARDVICHGDPRIIKEGYKSFPSGHTSCKSHLYLQEQEFLLKVELNLWIRNNLIDKRTQIVSPIVQSACIKTCCKQSKPTCPNPGWFRFDLKTKKEPISLYFLIKKHDLFR